MLVDMEKKLVKLSNKAKYIQYVLSGKIDLRHKTSEQVTTLLTGFEFIPYGLGIVWSGSLWVTVGQGINNTLAYSTNGLLWTGLGITIFSNQGCNISWSRELALWVAVGQGINSSLSLYILFK